MDVASMVKGWNFQMRPEGGGVTTAQLFWSVKRKFNKREIN